MRALLVMVTLSVLVLLLNMEARSIDSRCRGWLRGTVVVQEGMLTL